MTMPDEETIFNEARRIDDPAARAAYLVQTCGDDEPLRSRIESLLNVHEQQASFLGSPATDPDAVTSLDPPILFTPPGTMIGRYKLLEPIGEGGYGTVFMAEQTTPVQRKVALKIIKAGMDTKQVIARFEAERQALALMDHPNIAKVFDAGVTDTGRPYFVMELVRGVPITKYCDQHHLPPRARLELFMQVCQAVQHAHQKGIIHRDIKPSNVLIALYDGKPVPKVIDFGVAKATGQQLTERTMFTGFGDVIGTLEYMSPEQAEVNQLDIDTRSDIYSLGVLLYELLTGSTPIEHKRVREVALLEVLRVIREEEPPRPSTRLTTTAELPSIAAQRGLEPQRLSRMVHGELDWIVMKALEKDRSRRYETANGFARDIERYLADEPVLACPPSTMYRFRKFTRRHRTGLLATAAAFAVLVVLVVGLAISNRMIARERNEKAAAYREAESQRQRAEKNFLKARQAVAELMAQPGVGMGEWSQMPVPLRKKFFDAAVKYYRSLLEEGSDEPSLRYETAVGYRSIGFLHHGVGEFAQAEKHVRDSIAILEPLTREDPHNRDYRQQLAWSRMLLGWALTRTARPAEAKPIMEQAAAALEKLLSENPKDQSYTNELAECYRNLVQACEQQWKDLDAEEFKQRSLDLLATFPTHLPHTYMAYRRVGENFSARGLADDAVGMHRKALALLERMVDYEVASNALTNDNLRQTYRLTLAQALIAAKRGDEVVQVLERALEFDQTSHDNWYRAAVLYLAAGDLDNYRRTCQQILDRFCQGEVEPHIAERTVKLCSLVPGGAGDPQRVAGLADRALVGTESHPWRWYFELAKGMAEHRAGRHAIAVQWLQRVKPDAERGWPTDAMMFSVLAMAHHELHQAEDARAALASAGRVIQKSTPDDARGQTTTEVFRPDWIEAEIVFRESEQLLKEPTTQTTQRSDETIELKTKG